MIFFQVRLPQFGSKLMESKNCLFNHWIVSLFVLNNVKRLSNIQKIIDLNDQYSQNANSQITTFCNPTIHILVFVLYSCLNVNLIHVSMLICCILILFLPNKNCNVNTKSQVSKRGNIYCNQVGESFLSYCDLYRLYHNVTMNQHLATKDTKFLQSTVCASYFYQIKISF